MGTNDATTTFIDQILPPFIYFIIFIKIIFLIMTLSNIYFKKVSKNNDNKNKNKDNIFDAKTIYWKERTEFIFIICMSILLIVIFNPRYNNERFLTKETKILLFIFGIILIISADWSIFITEAKWFTKIKHALK